MSKWDFGDGTFELRKCEILEFLAESEHFRIRWPHNSRTKRATRFNILFDGENKEKLELRIAEAQRLRQRGELMMRYHFMVQSTEGTRTSPVPDAVKTRISFRIASHSPFQRILASIKSRTDNQTKMVAK